MALNWYRLNRKIHYWASICIVISLLVISGTGILLIIKKQFPWVQPKTMKGAGKIPNLSFDQILGVAKGVPEAKIESWKNIDRLDVRPGKGIVKIRAKNNWEIQADHQTGKILQVAFRRSDIIESIHDGSFFHKYIKLGYFLPTAIVLIFLCATGIYLFYLPFFWKSRKKLKQDRRNGIDRRLSEDQRRKLLDDEVKEAA